MFTHWWLFIELAFRLKQIKNLESGSEDLVEQAAKIGDTLKSLETLSKVLGGLLNVAFGVENILSGVQEIQKGGSQKLDGMRDIKSDILAC